MTALPASGYPSNAARTEAEMKQYFEDTLAAAAESLGGRAETALVISGGSIIPTLGIHTVDTEGGAASDDLDRLAVTTQEDGRLVLLRCADAARVVTIRHAQGGSGQILTRSGTSIVLDQTKKWVLLKRTGTSWEELARFGFELVVPATTGTSTAYALDPGAERPYGYYAGLKIRGRAHIACGASPTINVTGVGGAGLGIKNLRKIAGGAKVALAANDLATGQGFEAVYDGTEFVLLAQPVVAGSESAAGILALADASTTIAGTNNTKAVHPAGGAAAYEPRGKAGGSNVQNGTSYTFVLTDAGIPVPLGNAAAITLTVPPNSSVAFGPNTLLLGFQKGTGQVTIAPGSGVTLNAPDGKLKTRARYSWFELYRDPSAADTWYVFGDLAA